MCHTSQTFEVRFFTSAGKENNERMANAFVGGQNFAIVSLSSRRQQMHSAVCREVGRNIKIINFWPISDFLSKFLLVCGAIKRVSVPNQIGLGPNNEKSD